MRVDILGVGVDSLSLSEAAELVERNILAAVPVRAITANPELIYRAASDTALKQLINSAQLVTADGVGVLWAAGFLGSALKERVTGIDLLNALLPIAQKRQWKVYFLGGAPGVAAEALARVQSQFPGICGASHHGFFTTGKEELALLAEIKSFQPQLLFVGLGAPRQEQWIANNYRMLMVPFAMGVGGSFDVLSGRIKRAPLWAQRLKVEWLARLLKEPKRVKRQLVLPKFVIKTLLYKHKINPHKN